MPNSGVPHVPTLQWTTRRGGSAEQFGMWEDAIADAFVPVSVVEVAVAETDRPDPSVRPPAAGFLGEVAARRFGRVQLADLASDPQSVARTAAHITRVRGDMFFLNLPLSDGSSARQAGRSCELKAHDFVVVDGDEPFALNFEQSFRQLSLSLPRDLLEARLVDPAAVTAQRAIGSDGIGSVASAAIRAAASTSATIDSRSAAALGEHLVDLVALALGGLRPQALSTPAHLLLQAARGQVERRLADADLSPALVAHEIGISVRYLHRLFSDHGTTFGRGVQARRLDRAHHLLVDPAAAGRSVAQVATSCGFADPGYFARVFRAAYGLSPSALRSDCALSS